MIRFIFLLSVATALSAQTAAPPVEKCTMEGQILDAALGAPIKKVQVTLRRVEGRNSIGAGATTDAAGRFSLRDIDPGRYRLWAERTGYVRQEYGARSSGRQGTVLTLESGQRLADVTLRLTPHSVITGTIVDEDAEPLANVSVQLLKFSYRNGRKQLSPAGYGQTNDVGQYRIYGVEPGRYYITAIYRQPYGIVSRTPEVYAPTYYPGTTDALGAAALEFTPGSQVGGINLSMRKRPAVSLRGSIGRPGAVSLWPRNSSVAEFNRNGARVRDRSGNFELRGVLPGSYILATDFEDGDTRYSARLPIEVGATDIDGIKLTPMPGANISGVARTEGDAPVSLSQVRIYLQSDAGPNAGNPAATVKDNGAFTLENVAAGTYALNVTGVPDGYYLKSIRFGDREVLDAPLDLSNGGAGSLDVAMGASAGLIDGVAMGPKLQPSPGATVVLIPEQGRRDQLYRYKTSTTDQYGRFKLPNIPPGEYKVFAWEDMEPGAYMDPDFLKPVEEKGQAFSVKENTHESVQLKLIGAEENGPSNSSSQP